MGFASDMSSIKISVISCVNLSIWPAMSFPLNLFLLAVLMGTNDLYHFIPYPVTCESQGQQKAI